MLFSKGLTDKFCRHISYLRISITDRCNLRCIYCMPANTTIKLAHEDVLTYEEILRVATVAARIGVTKVRVTGGEPFVRKGAAEFLAKLAQVPGVRETTLTTNAMLLERRLPALAEAGIRRLNISLDTLKPDRFKSITGFDGFERVWSAIMAAHAAGFAPIKINVVAIRGVNDDELADLAALSLQYPFHIRFIEYMPVGHARAAHDQPLLTPEIQARIQTLGRLQPVRRQGNDGPAKRFQFAAAPGEVGFISAMSSHFCQTCNRLRLTASGQLRPCLLSDAQVDLRQPLRAGCDDDALAACFYQAVASKPSHHHLAADAKTGVETQMAGIGG